jgi:hypothetical protein
MKKHILISAYAFLIFHHQTVFCMDQQSINQQFVVTEPYRTANESHAQPCFKTNLLNKVAGIKNWITHHKKEILVGGMALAVVTAAALYYYTSQIAPLHAHTIDAFNTVTPTPPSAPIFFNTTAHQYCNPQELLAAADACARVPTHCWVEPDQTVANKFLLYGSDGKKYDYKIPGCSRQDLGHLYNGYQACYNAISNYAREHGLSDVQAKITIALEQAKRYWSNLKFYKGLKW